MYQQILLAVALQHWEEFTSHALAAREVAVALAKGCWGDVIGVERLRLR